MPKDKRCYKALITDVDGTLVSNKYDGKISKKVRDTILKSKKHISFGIASGRPLDRVLFIFEELNLTRPCIVAGGAQIVDPQSRNILWEQPITVDDALEVLSVITKYDSKIWVINGTKEVLYNEGMVIEKPISFFLSKIEESKADEIIASLQHIETLALTKVVAYGEGYISLHITHAKATKKHAVRKLAEILKLEQSDIIGVGDGHNDYPLFRACGLRIAVGNAVDGLKAEADYIAPDVEQDAIADVIEKFVLN